MRPGNIRWVWFPNPGLEKLALLFQSLLSNKAKARFTIRGTEATLMDDLSNEFAGQGDYRSSENNITLGLTMLCVGLALGALTALLLAPKTGKQRCARLCAESTRTLATPWKTSAIRQATGSTKVQTGRRRRSNAWRRLASPSADNDNRPRRQFSLSAGSRAMLAAYGRLIDFEFKPPFKNSRVLW
jgi:hypothetical protein